MRSRRDTPGFWLDQLFRMPSSAPAQRYVFRMADEEILERGVGNLSDDEANAVRRLLTWRGDQFYRVAALLGAAMAARAAAREADGADE